MKDYLISFKDVDLGYGNLKILNKLNIDIKSGEFLGFVGPNGAGKTTILRAILGLLKPQKGKIERKNVHVAYVPQRDSMDETFPLTAHDIVLMGRYPFISLFKRPSNSDRDKAMESLEYIGMSDYKNSFYSELSGGQKQRVLIARALASDPQLLILDEPTSQMDLSAETSIMELIREIHITKGITVILVSHLLNLVVNYAYRIGLVENSTVTIDSTDKMLTERNLKSIYNLDVRVVDVGNRRIVLGGSW